METVTFTVPGQPVGKARPRVTRYSTYTPEKTRAYESLIRMYYKEAAPGAKPFAGEVRVSITAVFDIPKSYTVRRKQAILAGAEQPLKKPDADNIAKCFLDALNGLAWNDDAQVIFLEVKKQYMTSLLGGPCVHVTVEG